MVKTISNTDLKDCPCKGARISFDKSVEEFTTQVIGENDREDRNEWNLTALCYEEKKKERGKKMKKKEGGGNARTIIIRDDSAHAQAFTFRGNTRGSH